MNIDEIKMPMCKMADNFYHIGVRGGPCYMLESAEGLVLIDTSFSCALPTLLQNISDIGKRAEDITHIIHTHGHFDHVGSTSALLRLCNARTYIGEGDEDCVMGKSPLLYAGEAVEELVEPFVPDVIVNDGQILDLGDTKIKFVSTPGHTMGTLSLFFDVRVNGKAQRAGMFGGAGLNTLSRAYLEENRLPISMQKDFIRSIDKILGEQVEFHIGNHLSDNNYHEKILRMNEKQNPFLAENTYKSFLLKRKSQAIELFARDSGGNYGKTANN